VRERELTTTAATLAGDAQKFCAVCLQVFSVFSLTWPSRLDAAAVVGLQRSHTLHTPQASLFARAQCEVRRRANLSRLQRGPRLAGPTSDRTTTGKRKL
jgi:hypothetical protein